ncbi:unnamed protein product [Caenorhabditis nigoni]
MATRNDECEKAIRFISNSIKNYTEPESLARWCEMAKTEAGNDKSADSFGFVIRQRLDKIEDLKGYSLMEKVRLVFLFSRPVSDVFVKELRGNKCVVELNDERKITYFRSAGGDCVLQSDQDPNSNTRKFQGKPIQQKTRPITLIQADDCEKAIKFMSSRIVPYTKPESLSKWCELAKAETGYDKCASTFSWAIRKRLDKIEDLKGYSLIEKVRLVFLFSRPVSPGFIEILEEEKCVLELNDSERITYFRSPDGTCVLQSNHNKLDKYFKGKPYFHKRRKAEIQVRNSENVQTQPPPANPQILPDPPEMDDVEMVNEEEEEAQEREKQENNSPDKKKEMNRDTSTKQKSNLRSEEDVDVTTESIQQEAPVNGQIDYDDLDNGEYPEFMVPNEIEPPNHHKKRHPEPCQVNPKRLKIDRPRESGLVDPSEMNNVEMRSGEVEEAQELEQSSEVSNEPACRVNNESDIQNQVAQVEHQSIGNNRLQKFIQNERKRVKIEDFLEEIEQPPEEWIPDEKPEMPPPTISLLKLAEQIETFAFNIYLDESFQQKTLRAVRLFKTNDQIISIQEFNVIFNGMLTGLRRERIQNTSRNSLQLIRLFKQIQRNVIRPLGGDLMAEALGSLDDEIQKLGESEDEIPLKSVQIKIDSLMSLITSSWANLDE